MIYMEVWGQIYPAYFIIFSLSLWYLKMEWSPFLWIHPSVIKLLPPIYSTNFLYYQHSKVIVRYSQASHLCVSGPSFAYSHLHAGLCFQGAYHLVEKKDIKQK